MTTKYKPGKEMVMADSLFWLYTCMMQGTNQLNLDWPMLIMKDLDEGFPPATSMQTQEMVIKNKHLFWNHYGMLHCILPEGGSMPYIPTSQQVDTTLRWHHNLGHTWSQNLLEILWSKCWWPHTAKDIQEILQ